MAGRPRKADLGSARAALTFHPEVLRPRQTEALEQLGAALVSTRFYLAGGTALAIQLGHRDSVDLDWFCKARLRDPEALAQRLTDQGVALKVRDTAQGTLLAEVGGVSVSFMEHRYAQLGPHVRWPAMKCRLASLADLAAMKTSAVSSRGAKKDFVDIFALVQSGFTIAQIIASFQKKYAIEDTYHVRKSLTFFDDAEKDRIPRMLWDAEWSKIKESICQWVKELKP